MENRKKYTIKKTRSRHGFFPVIASSLALALGFNVVVADTPQIAFGTTPDAGASGATQNVNLGLSWKNSGGGLLAPQANGTVINNLLFQFDGRYGTANNPSGALSGDSYIVTVGSTVSSERQPYLLFQSTSGIKVNSLSFYLTEGSGSSTTYPRTMELDLSGVQSGYALDGNLNILVAETWSSNSVSRFIGGFGGEGISGDVILKKQNPSTTTDVEASVATTSFTFVDQAGIKGDLSINLTSGSHSFIFDQGNIGGKIYIGGAEPTNTGASYDWRKVNSSASVSILFGKGDNLTLDSSKLELTSGSLTYGYSDGTLGSKEITFTQADAFTGGSITFKGASKVTLTDNLALSPQTRYSDQGAEWQQSMNASFIFNESDVKSKQNQSSSPIIVGNIRNDGGDTLLAINNALSGVNPFENPGSSATSLPSYYLDGSLSISNGGISAFWDDELGFVGKLAFTSSHQITITGGINRLNNAWFAAGSFTQPLEKIAFSNYGANHLVFEDNMTITHGITGRDMGNGVSQILFKGDVNIGKIQPEDPNDPSAAVNNNAIEIKNGGARPTLEIYMAGNGTNTIDGGIYADGNGYAGIKIIKITSLGTSSTTAITGEIYANGVPNYVGENHITLAGTSNTLNQVTAFRGSNTITLDGATSNEITGLVHANYGSNYLNFSSNGSNTLHEIKTSNGGRNYITSTTNLTLAGQILANSVGSNSNANVFSLNNLTFASGSSVISGTNVDGWGTKNLFEVNGEVSFSSDLIIRSDSLANAGGAKYNIFKFNGTINTTNNTIGEVTAATVNNNQWQTKNVLSFDGLSAATDLTITDINKEGSIPSGGNTNGSGYIYIGKNLTQGSGDELSLSFDESNWSSDIYQAENLNLTVSNRLFAFRGGKNFINVGTLHARTISNDRGTNYIITSNDFTADSISSNWKGANNIIVENTATIGNISVGGSDASDTGTNTITFKGAQATINGNITALRGTNLIKVQDGSTLTISGGIASDRDSGSNNRITFDDDGDGSGSTVKIDGGIFAHWGSSQNNIELGEGNLVFTGGGIYSKDGTNNVSAKNITITASNKTMPGSSSQSTAGHGIRNVGGSINLSSTGTISITAANSASAITANNGVTTLQAETILLNGASDVVRETSNAELRIVAKNLEVTRTAVQYSAIWNDGNSKMKITIADGGHFYALNGSGGNKDIAIEGNSVFQTTLLGNAEIKADFIAAASGTANKNIMNFGTEDSTGSNNVVTFKGSLTNSSSVTREDSFNFNADNFTFAFKSASDVYQAITFGNTRANAINFNATNGKFDLGTNTLNIEGNLAINLNSEEGINTITTSGITTSGSGTSAINFNAENATLKINDDGAGSLSTQGGTATINFAENILGTFNGVINTTGGATNIVLAQGSTGIINGNISFSGAGQSNATIVSDSTLTLWGASSHLANINASGTQGTLLLDGKSANGNTTHVTTLTLDGENTHFVTKDISANPSSATFSTITFTADNQVAEFNGGNTTISAITAATNSILQLSSGDGETQEANNTLVHASGITGGVNVLFTGGVDDQYHYSTLSLTGASNQIASVTSHAKNAIIKLDGTNGVANATIDQTITVGSGNALIFALDSTGGAVSATASGGITVQGGGIFGISVGGGSNTKSISITGNNNIDFQENSTLLVDFQENASGNVALGSNSGAIVIAENRNSIINFRGGGTATVNGGIEIAGGNNTVNFLGNATLSNITFTSGNNTINVRDNGTSQGVTGTIDLSTGSGQQLGNMTNTINLENNATLVLNNGSGSGVFTSNNSSRPGTLNFIGDNAKLQGGFGASGDGVAIINVGMPSSQRNLATVSGTITGEVSDADLRFNAGKSTLILQNASNTFKTLKSNATDGILHLQTSASVVNASVEEKITIGSGTSLTIALESDTTNNHSATFTAKKGVLVKGGGTLGVAVAGSGSGTRQVVINGGSNSYKDMFEEGSTLRVDFLRDASGSVSLGNGQAVVIGENRNSVINFYGGAGKPTFAGGLTLDGGKNTVNFYGDAELGNITLRSGDNIINVVDRTSSPGITGRVVVSDVGSVTNTINLGNYATLSLETVSGGIAGDGVLTSSGLSNTLNFIGDHAKLQGGFGATSEGSALINVGDSSSSAIHATISGNVSHADVAFKTSEGILTLQGEQNTFKTLSGYTDGEIIANTLVLDSTGNDVKAEIASAVDGSSTVGLKFGVGGNKQTFVFSADGNYISGGIEFDEYNATSENTLAFTKGMSTVNSINITGTRSLTLAFGDDATDNTAQEQITLNMENGFIKENGTANITLRGVNSYGVLQGGDIDATALKFEATELSSLAIQNANATFGSVDASKEGILTLDALNSASGVNVGLNTINGGQLTVNFNAGDENKQAIFTLNRDATLKTITATNDSMYNILKLQTGVTTTVSNKVELADAQALSIDFAGGSLSSDFDNLGELFFNFNQDGSLTGDINTLTPTLARSGVGGRTTFNLGAVDGSSASITAIVNGTLGFSSGSEYVFNVYGQDTVFKGASGLAFSDGRNTINFDQSNTMLSWKDANGGINQAITTSGGITSINFNANNATLASEISTTGGETDINIQNGILATISKNIATSGGSTMVNFASGNGAKTLVLSNVGGTYTISGVSFQESSTNNLIDLSGVDNTTLEITDAVYVGDNQALSIALKKSHLSISDLATLKEAPTRAVGELVESSGTTTLKVYGDVATAVSTLNGGNAVLSTLSFVDGDSAQLTLKNENTIIKRVSIDTNITSVTLALDSSANAVNASITNTLAGAKLALDFNADVNKSTKLTLNGSNNVIKSVSAQSENDNILALSSGTTTINEAVSIGASKAMTFDLQKSGVKLVFGGDLTTDAGETNILFSNAPIENEDGTITSPNYANMTLQGNITTSNTGVTNLNLAEKVNATLNGALNTDGGKATITLGENSSLKLNKRATTTGGETVFDFVGSSAKISGNIVTTGGTTTFKLGETSLDALTASINGTLSNSGATQKFEVNAKNVAFRYGSSGLVFDDGNNNIIFTNTEDSTLSWQNSSGINRAIATTGGTTTIKVNDGASGSIVSEVLTRNGGTTKVIFADGSGSKTLALQGANNSITSIDLGESGDSTNNTLILGSKVENASYATSVGSQISVDSNDSLDIDFYATQFTLSNGMQNAGALNLDFLYGDSSFDGLLTNTGALNLTIGLDERRTKNVSANFTQGISGTIKSIVFNGGIPRKQNSIQDYSVRTSLTLGGQDSSITNITSNSTNAQILFDGARSINITGNVAINEGKALIFGFSGGGNATVTLSNPLTVGANQTLGISIGGDGAATKRVDGTINFGNGSTLLVDFLETKSGDNITATLGSGSGFVIGSGSNSVINLYGGEGTSELNGGVRLAGGNNTVNFYGNAELKGIELNSGTNTINVSSDKMGKLDVGQISQVVNTFNLARNSSLVFGDGNQTFISNNATEVNFNGNSAIRGSLSIAGGEASINLSADAQISRGLNIEGGNTQINFLSSSTLDSAINVSGGSTQINLNGNDAIFTQSFEATSSGEVLFDLSNGSILILENGLNNAGGDVSLDVNGSALVYGALSNAGGNTTINLSGKLSLENGISTSLGTSTLNFQGSNNTLTLKGDSSLSSVVNSSSSARAVNDLKYGSNNTVTFYHSGRNTKDNFKTLVIGSKGAQGNGNGIVGEGLNFVVYATSNATPNTSSVYADKVVIHSASNIDPATGKNKTTQHNLGVEFQRDANGNAINLSGISYKDGGDNNILLATVANDSGVVFNQSEKTVVDFSVAKLTYATQVTDENGGNASSDYTSYYLAKAVADEVVVAEQAVVATAFALNYDLYMANFNSLNKRMGELRDNAHSQGVWARVFNGGQTNKQGLESKSNYTTIQAGYDYAFGFEGANNYLGFALSYALSTSSISSKAVDSMGQVRGIDNIYSNAVEVAVYNSYVSDMGWYNDTIAKFSYLMSSFDIDNFNTNSNTKNDTNNFAFTLGDEVGYIFKLGDSKEWSITPQAEFTFGYFNQSDFKQTLEGSVAYLDSMADAVLTLRARAGSSFGYDFKNFTQDKDFNASLYVGAFYEYDYVSGGDISMTTDQGAHSNELGSIGSDGRVVVNVGTNMTIKDNTRLYFDFEKSFIGEITTDYQINMGVRYSFGESNGYTPMAEKTEFKAPLKIEDGEENKGDTEAKEGVENKDKAKKDKAENKEDVENKKDTKEIQDQNADSETKEEENAKNTSKSEEKAQENK